MDHFPEDLGEGWEARIVQLPIPERPAEAYAAALVYQAPASSWLFFKRPALLRYFTMEKGFDLSGAAVSPVAAEWTRKGARRRIGEVERLNNEAFLLEIAKTLFGL